MLGLGWGEIFLMAAVALVVVGPERLPRLLRDLGRYYGQLRRAADDLRRSFVLEADRQDAEERYRELQERRQKAAEARRAAASEDSANGASSAVDGAPVLMGHVSPELDGEAPEAPDAPDPNAEDPEAPHPIQVARGERP